MAGEPPVFPFGTSSLKGGCMTTVTETLALAAQCHRRGQLQEAEQIYQQVLQMEPGHVLALHCLGVLYHQVGKRDLAIEYLGQVVRAQPDNVEASNSLGIALATADRFEEAVARYQDVLRLRPSCAEVHNNLGAALAALNKLDEAVSSYLQALRIKPDFAEAHCNLGRAYLQQRKFHEAEVSCRQALGLKPVYPKAHNSLGNVFLAQGKLEEAVSSFQQALHLKPDLVEALVNLGVVRAAQGRLDEAVAGFKQALRLQPELAEALNNLGSALRRLGKLKEAAACCQRALHLKPNYADAHHNLGRVRKLQGKPDEAVAYFQQAVQFAPDFADAHFSLAEALQEQGKLDEAVRSWQEALSLKPDWMEEHPIGQPGFVAQERPDDAPSSFRQVICSRATARLRILQAAQLPPIYQSEEEIHYWRKRLIDHLQQLCADQIRHDLTHHPAKPLFFLPYQGFNDRDIQRQYSRIFSAPRELLGQPAPVGRGHGRIQVGFISRHLNRHTIGYLMGGMIANLSRKELSITVLSIGHHDDEVAGLLRRQAERYIELPENLEATRRIIADLGLDILFYTDIGMDSTAYSLAFSRLAPVQCVTWGHPSTTGIDTIDYFLSSDLLEAEDAAEHYTESLVRFKSLPIYYYRPALPSPLKERGHFGLTDNAHVYGCPQSLFKLHPEFDEILGGILREDPLAQVVLLHGWSRHWDELLRKRFSTTIPDVRERIRFVPPQSREDFLSLNAAADVLLDPIHFGGGNTSYEGLALGIPIVTLPSPFLRGRITLALYKQMEVLDCVAANPAEYIRIAVKLGTEPEYRALVRSKIVAANEALYENLEGVRELERFFQEAVARARSS
jgi:predicted O-linked N-acetylglucosamine transferase (SPINDLY family)